MYKGIRRLLIVVSINILVFIGILVAVEFAFRWVSSAPAQVTPIQWQKFQPYMMFTNPHNPSASFQWIDQYRNNAIISSKMVNNKYGFTMNEEVDFAKIRQKGTNERVIIFTGGSAAWGVGASSSASSTAGRLEALLNVGQAKYRYKVLNLAMGGWNSFQQLIALAMFGRNLQPDWLVSMDGTNDVAVACAHSQGAGNPMHFALMDAYINGYVYGHTSPVFFRGTFENYLLKRSAAYRAMSGKKPVEIDVLLDERDPTIGRSVIRPTTWADVERQLEFYLQTEVQMADLFPVANVILSTQPLPFDFEEMYGRFYQSRGTMFEGRDESELNNKLDDIRRSQQGANCGLEGWTNARQWFMPSSAMRLEGLVDRMRNTSRNIHYVNPGVLFPKSFEMRKRFFIDAVHLNDAGMDHVARLYSQMILAVDFPDKFKMPAWAGKPLSGEPPLVAANVTAKTIGVMEATYGMNCKDFKVPPPAMNRVNVGNATKVVSDACTGKEGACDYTVDVVALGDPAGNCGKDFLVKWRCGMNRETLQSAYLKGESNGQKISLSCSAK